MFYCQVTGKLSKPGEKCHKVVTQKAARVYTKMIRDEETRKMVRVEIGRGWEIVKEIDASEEGARLWNEAHPNGPVLVERPKPKVSKPNA